MLSRILRLCLSAFLVLTLAPTSPSPTPIMTAGDRSTRALTVGAVMRASAVPDRLILESSSLLSDEHMVERARRRTPAPKPKAELVAVKPTPTKGWRRDPEISWYGPGLYGHGTACGKTLTRTTIGVAHRTLPCGTKVTFRNPKTGEQITVKVIDRGPYVRGRTWDLTSAACKAIHHCYTGPISVRMGG